MSINFTEVYQHTSQKFTLIDMLCRKEITLTTSKEIEMLWSASKGLTELHFHYNAASKLLQKLSQTQFYTLGLIDICLYVWGDIFALKEGLFLEPGENPSNQELDSLHQSVKKLPLVITSINNC